MYKEMFKMLKLPDYFSLAGLVLALVSIFMSFRGEIALAVLFIYLSVVADFLDGKVARYMKRQGNFGKTLDSLCDVVLYLLGIVIFSYAVGLQSTAAIIGYIFFIVAGITRLTRFTLMGTVENCYVGMPVSCSLIVPPLYYILAHFNISLNYMLIFFYAMPFLMVSSIKVKKFIK